MPTILNGYWYHSERFLQTLEVGAWLAEQVTRARSVKVSPTSWFLPSSALLVCCAAQLLPHVSPTMPGTAVSSLIWWFDPPRSSFKLPQQAPPQQYQSDAALVVIPASPVHSHFGLHLLPDSGALLRPWLRPQVILGPAGPEVSSKVDISPPYLIGSASLSHVSIILDCHFLAEGQSLFSVGVILKLSWTVNSFW